MTIPTFLHQVSSVLLDNYLPPVSDKSVLTKAGVLTQRANVEPAYIIIALTSGGFA
ncbi:hypothetical protein NR352_17835 [Enterobacter soli]|uniref:hypothetical protein n=1 Tax=Enterobacter soli TaxID=885040 RepID=UPI0021479786|nr:hypothetical protein [Enterobacter soli]MCR1318822.1 hypothetical protein [Enterobacter soli]HDR2471400.1 hypothetical protein [Enterobacter soli]